MIKKENGSSSITHTSKWMIISSLYIFIFYSSQLAWNCQFLFNIHPLIQMSIISAPWILVQCFQISSKSKSNNLANRIRCLIAGSWIRITMRCQNNHQNQEKKYFKNSWNEQTISVHVMIDDLYPNELCVDRLNINYPFFGQQTWESYQILRQQLMSYFLFTRNEIY